MSDELLQRVKASLDPQKRSLTVDELVRVYGVERRVAIETLKALEREGLGRFRVGRGSTGQFKTRIEFADTHTNRLVGTSAMSMMGSSVATLPIEEKSRTCISHIFPLDDELNVQLTLPRDLSKSEAESLTRFIMSLARRE